MNKFNSPEVILNVKNVSFSYFKGINKTEVLNNISFDLNKGEMVALVGPSGSGKSTLLNLIGLLEELKSGKIYLNKKLINPNSVNDRNKIRLNEIGFVFQFHRLLNEFTAIENIAIPQMLTGLNKELSIKRAEELLDMMGLRNRKNSKPGQLSGGEQQRVAIARALITSPKIILADEPTGNLDPNVSDEILDLLETFTVKGTTVLMSTHNFPLIKPRKRRFIELNKGRIVD